MGEGFGKSTATQRFTAEILRRDLITGQEKEEEEYVYRLRRLPGKKGWEQCVKDAVEHAHLRIHDLLYTYCQRTGQPEYSVAFDAFIWRNRAEGEPIFRISTAPFAGSKQIPAICDPSKSAQEIVAEKELSRMIKKF